MFIIIIIIINYFFVYDLLLQKVGGDEVVVKGLTELLFFVDVSDDQLATLATTLEGLNFTRYIIINNY